MLQRKELGLGPKSFEGVGHLVSHGRHEYDTGHEREKRRTQQDSALKEPLANRMMTREAQDQAQKPQR